MRSLGLPLYCFPLLETFTGLLFHPPLEELLPLPLEFYVPLPLLGIMDNYDVNAPSNDAFDILILCS